MIECIRCKSKLLVTKNHCKSCRIVVNGWSLRYYRRCGKFRYAKDREKFLERSKARRKYLASENKCQRCGRKDPLATKVLCGKCRLKKVSQQRANALLPKDNQDQS